MGLIQLKQQYHKYKALVPTLIMTCLCIYTVYESRNGTVEINGLVYEFHLTSSNYVAFALVLLCLLFFFTIKPGYKYIVTFTLLMGIFGWIRFTQLDYFYGFSFGILGITFQATSFLIGLITFILNFNEIVAKIIKLNPPPKDQSLFDPTENHKAEVLRFKKKYHEFSSKELEEIKLDKRFTAAAIEAATQILQERTTSSTIDNFV